MTPPHSDCVQPGIIAPGTLYCGSVVLIVQSIVLPPEYHIPVLWKSIMYVPLQTKTWRKECYRAQLIAAGSSFRGRTGTVPGMLHRMYIVMIWSHRRIKLQPPDRNEWTTLSFDNANEWTGRSTTPWQTHISCPLWAPCTARAASASRVLVMSSLDNLHDPWNLTLDHAPTCL